MRIHSIFFALVAAGLPSHGSAQTEQEVCQMLAGPMLESSDALVEMSSALTTMDFDRLATMLDGAEAAQVRELAQSRDDMLPTFVVFLEELEQTALMMRRCAR